MDSPKTNSETEHTHLNEQQTRRVVYLTAAMMVVEIGFGYWTNSMALLADGWHMASHVFAIGLTWVAYIAARKYAESEKFSFSQKKLLALSGFTSAVVLQIVALLMAYESIARFFNPLPIRFGDAKAKVLRRAQQKEAAVLKKAGLLLGDKSMSTAERIRVSTTLPGENSSQEGDARLHVPGVPDNWQDFLEASQAVDHCLRLLLQNPESPSDDGGIEMLTKSCEKFLGLAARRLK